jgi:hypothetical protein
MCSNKCKLFCRMPVSINASAYAVNTALLIPY